MSLLNSKVFELLKIKPVLSKKTINLQSVNGENLQVQGQINIDMEMSGTKLNHNFYVVSNMNRNIILGQDFLTSFGVRMYFDLGCLRINNTYIPFVEDIHIASIVRVTANITIKPQTSYLCKGKIKRNPQLPSSGLYQVTASDKGYIGDQPGLMVANSVVKLGKSRQVPVLIVNNSNKTHKLKRNCIIGQVEQVSEENVVTATSDDKNSDRCYTPSDIYQELNCPEAHRREVADILMRNSELLAKRDSDLTQTDTVTMKIDTGDHPPIKLRPYRTPINNRPIVDKAIDEMLEGKIIERSRSPWSFGIVLVTKRDGSTRFCVDYRKLNNITRPISHRYL